MPYEEQKEIKEINNLQYMLHTAPIIDCISLASIAVFYKTFNFYQGVPIEKLQKWMEVKK